MWTTDEEDLFVVEFETWEPVDPSMGGGVFGGSYGEFTVTLRRPGDGTSVGASANGVYGDTDTEWHTSWNSDDVLGRQRVREERPPASGSAFRFSLRITPGFRNRIMSVEPRTSYVEQRGDRYSTVGWDSIEPAEHFIP